MSAGATTRTGAWRSTSSTTRPVRWLKTADVRKVIQALPSDPVLERLFPAGLRSMPGPGPAAGSTMRISAEALADYLAKSTDPDSLRFKRWLEREVAVPARRLRGSLPPAA